MKKILKKLFSKRRLKRASQGVISIFLCLLLTPFMTISFSLIEYARYQQFVEIADELMDLLGTSELANYDQYIHQRFGLLTVSQGDALGSGAAELLTANASALAGQMNPDNIAVVGLGGATLKENRVLLKQVTDMSELTATMAVVMKDLDLEKVLKKLQENDDFSSVMNTVGGLATATDAVTAVVEAANTLKTDLETAKQNITNLTTTGTTLASKISDFVKKLGDEGITLPESATQEQINEALKTFQDKYLGDINEIYKLAGDFNSGVTNVKTSLGKLKGDVTALTKAISDAKTAIKNIGSNNADKDGKASEATVTNLTDILDEMEKLVKDSLSSIKDETINTMTSAVQDCLDIILEGTGLSGVAKKYSQVLSGKYFVVDGDTGSLSDEAKQDVIDFLKMAYQVYSSHKNGSDEEVASAIKGYFEDRFIPKHMDSIDFQGIINKIGDVISKAGGDMKEKGTTKLTNMLTKLVNLARKVFKLSITYDPRLNNTVTLSNPAPSAAQDFADAVTALCTAVDNFKSSLGSANIIKALKSLADMLKAIKDMFTAIINKVTTMAKGIAGAFTGGTKKFYQRLIVSGYMFHSLPNRLDAGDYVEDSGFKKVVLDGSTLTGYDFNDISRGSKTFKACECEYIYSGARSEKVNQENLFWDLYFLRMFIDLPSVFTTEVNELAAAANIASWVVYILYIVIEPFLDVLLLVNGESVDVYKSYCWMTPSKIGTFVTKLVNATTDCEDLKKDLEGFVNDNGSDMGSGGGLPKGDSLELTYENYLLMLMTLTVSTDTQIQRLSNLIDLEMQQYCADNGGTFNLGETYVAVTVSADFTFPAFFDLGVASGGSPFIPEAHISRTVSY